MRKFITLTAAILFCGGTLGHAQDEQNHQFSARIGAQALKAQTLITDGQYSDAIGVIDKALSEGSLSNFERATLLRMQGSSYFELGDHSRTIQSFKASLEAGGLPKSEHTQIEVALAQLLIANGQSLRGADILEKWHRNGGQLSSAHFQLLTQAWIDQKNFSKALPWAKRWFDGVSVKERKHFDLLYFIYAQLEDRPRQADVIRQMITRWPDDKTLWQSWASVLSAAGEERAAFDVNVLMYDEGLLTEEAELLRLVQYYGFYDIPYWGARLLEEEMAQGRVESSQENLEKLSNLWRQAREYDRAIPVLEKAVQKSTGDKLHAALGEALINRADCQKAERALKTAMDRGYDRGKGWMLIATCRYEKSQQAERPECKTSTKESRLITAKYKSQDEAVMAFEMVPGGSSQRNSANKWISFVKAERQAIEDRCTFIKEQGRLRCMEEIDRAYKEYPLTGVLDISDVCLSYKDAYDAEYRAGKEIFN